MIHSFHIPVMGIAFTVDSPIKVAHFGISSVISIVDDFLLEKTRDFYAKQYQIPVEPINRKSKDARTEAIASYLNVVQEIVTINWEKHIARLVNDASYRLEFFETLPNVEEQCAEWLVVEQQLSSSQLLEWAKEKFQPGSINVNIMTKLDKKNYLKQEELPVEYNDAHAALRGFAQSNLSSSVVLSAGMNMSLFGYMQSFSDFMPNEKGELKKQIIVKVSDYRSALVQGKMLAKKGLWVSEFRIESGLNCGGHAFATQGVLLGPVLEEFKEKREELHQELLAVWKDALTTPMVAEPTTKITAQGGVGTHEEHQFLLSYYGLDSVGWGSPFLLVPEAVTIDEPTMNQLVQATEKDLYLSDASPLGVRFNNLRNTSRQVDQYAMAAKNKPGSACTKKFLVSNTEFTDKAICSASSQYMKKAIKRLKESNLPSELFEAEKSKILEKECLCCGLSVSFAEQHELDTKIEGVGVSVCPGPNIAYFDKITSLKDMLQHIYGKKNIISRTDRPDVFTKEIQLYIDLLSEKIASFYSSPNDKEKASINQYIQNMKSGVNYYKSLFTTEYAKLNLKQTIQDVLTDIHQKLEEKQAKLVGELAVC